MARGQQERAALFTYLGIGQESQLVFFATQLRHDELDGWTDGYAYLGQAYGHIDWDVGAALFQVDGNDGGGQVGFIAVWMSSKTSAQASIDVTLEVLACLTAACWIVKWLRGPVQPD